MMKEYLDKSTLLDYLRARVEMGEYVVNDDKNEREKI